MSLVLFPQYFQVFSFKVVKSEDSVVKGSNGGKKSETLATNDYTGQMHKKIEFSFTQYSSKYFTKHTVFSWLTGSGQSFHRHPDYRESSCKVNRRVPQRGEGSPHSDPWPWACDIDP